MPGCAIGIHIGGPAELMVQLEAEADGTPTEWSQFSRRSDSIASFSIDDETQVSRFQRKSAFLTHET